MNDSVVLASQWLTITLMQVHDPLVIMIITIILLIMNNSGGSCSSIMINAVGRVVGDG